MFAGWARALSREPPSYGKVPMLWTVPVESVHCAPDGPLWKGAKCSSTATLTESGRKQGQPSRAPSVYDGQTPRFGR